MSTPKWIRGLCCDSHLRLKSKLCTRARLNELSAFLESDQSDRIDTIALYCHDDLSIGMIRTVFKCLHKRSKIRTVIIIVTFKHCADSTKIEWVVRTILNRAPTSTTIELELHEGIMVNPWIRALHLNTSITSLRFSRCRFSHSDIKDLVELLASNYTITQLSFTLSGHGMSTNDFTPLWTCLKCDLFIRSLSVDYVYSPVRDVSALVDVIKVNSTITSIELKGSMIRSSVRGVLANALNYNTTLTTIHLPQLQSKSREADGLKLIAVRLQRNRSFVHNPLTVLLRQTELTKEVERRKLIQQLKRNHSTRSLTKCGHHLPDEAKEERQSTKNKSELKLSSLAGGGIVPSAALSVHLNEYDVEYLRVNLDFHQSLASLPQYQGLKFNVTRIERITNSLLKEQFDRSYQHFLTHNYHSTKPIRSVYHSTKPENIPSIIQSNLSLAKVGVTGKGRYGKGMYFSPHADYTLAFWSTGQLMHVKAGDSGKILQFDILPGRMLHMKDFKIGAARTPHYDSHVSSDGFEYVMFDPRHILPRYIISFKVTQGRKSERPPVLSLSTPPPPPPPPLSPCERFICGLVVLSVLIFYVLLLYWLIRWLMKGGDESTLGHETSAPSSHNLTCPLPDALNTSKNVNSFVNQILSHIYLA